MASFGCGALGLLGGQVGVHKGAVERLHAREFMNMQVNKMEKDKYPQVKTQREMLQERKRILGEISEMKFCHNHKGMHGYDIPRYSEKDEEMQNKQWWTLRKGYNKDP